MTASQIMEKFREGTLHSGGSGKIVKKPRMARAILLSYLRKEGHHIPEKKESRMAHHFRKARRRKEQ